MLTWWVALAVTLLSVFVLLLLQKWRNVAEEETITKAAVGNVLLVTAHPDDECMFFSPTLLTLTTQTTDNNCRVYLLCLSEGNYYGKGSVRKHELVKSATILGLQSSNVITVNDSDLPDDPTVEWKSDIVGKYILETVRQNDIETIITFDERGISGHTNHIAIYNSIKGLQQQHLLTKAGIKKVFLLESTNIICKYTGWLGLIWNHSSHDALATINIANYLKARRAMQAHWSQYVWFRRLYILFSRYMIINTFRELTNSQQ